jgi:signal transduction histidine kinase
VSYADLQGDLTESLDQQTATSEILRVISSSLTDVQPVFDSIAVSARHLCDALYSVVFRFEEGMITLVADDGASPEWIAAIRSAYPAPPGRSSVAAQAILERRVIAIADAQGGVEYPHVAERAKAIGYRSIISVPMLRDDTVFGAINVLRTEVLPFSDTQIALLQTFADQAVIAIENVRLFTELQEKNLALTQAHAQVTEALDQQTATSEILRVISRSPTDVRPVFDTIARNARRLCEADSCSVFTYGGELIRLESIDNATIEGADAIRRAYPLPPSRGHATGRAILTGRPVHIPDVRHDPEYDLHGILGAGLRSIVAVPMLRAGIAIGTITLHTWATPRPFSATEIALLQTFADQAVIAIENVRLFKELEARNDDLTEALEQQTATSEILRVISSSPGDIQPVFDAIAANAARLCDAVNGLVIRFDGQLLHLAAHYNVDPERLAAVRQAYPRPPSRGALSGRAILTRAVVHVPDVSKDPEYTLPAATTIGYRSILAVPMMHEGVARGTILVARDVVAPFSDTHIALIQTFADQAVIAIENVRLLSELQARTEQLTQSVDKLTALGEVSQAVSSTLDVETVLSTIVSRASQLAGADGGSVYEYDEQSEAFHLRATDNLDDEVVVMARRTPVPRSEGVLGRMAVTREPVQVPDIGQPGAYRSPLRDVLLRTGTRALLAIPLLREDLLIGGLTVNKKTPGEFSPEVIDLLKTFASQSALAIQNARLFREIEAKGRQLEVASQHKSEFLANMSHELRTPLNAIIGFSEVLTERMFGELNEKQDEYLKDIYASGTHLLSLINDILDLSKIEAGRMELELTDFDLPTAIDNALTLVRERAGRRGITVHKAVDNRLGPIRADERKLRQVILNLLSNAIKFTPEGGRIEVTATPGAGAVEVSVIDTGVGIAPEDQEAVFEEFRQVGGADKKAEGTGLGLALCRKFVELHGGRIWVRSQVGAGSTFTFMLPVRS